MNEVQFIESMSVMEIKEGDTVVLKTRHRVSLTMANAVEQQVREMFIERGLKDIRVMVLEDGMNIGVIRYTSPDAHN